MLESSRETFLKKTMMLKLFPMDPLYQCLATSISTAYFSVQYGREVKLYHKANPNNSLMTHRCRKLSGVPSIFPCFHFKQLELVLKMTVWSNMAAEAQATTPDSR